MLRACSSFAGLDYFREADCRYRWILDRFFDKTSHICLTRIVLIDLVEGIIETAWCIKMSCTLPEGASDLVSFFIHYASQLHQWTVS